MLHSCSTGRIDRDRPARAHACSKMICDLWLGEQHRTSPPLHTYTSTDRSPPWWFPLPGHVSTIRVDLLAFHRCPHSRRATCIIRSGSEIRRPWV